MKSATFSLYYTSIRNEARDRMSGVWTTVKTPMNQRDQDLLNDLVRAIDKLEQKWGTPLAQPIETQVSSLTSMARRAYLLSA